MNYLSHYYADLSSREPAYALGKILPDLARMVNPAIRLRVHHLPVEIPDSLYWLNKGIMAHHRMDAVFHNADFFLKHTRFIRELMNNQTFGRPHKYFNFFAHLLFEMILDRVLIKKEPDIAQHFYDDLNLLPGDVLENLEKQYHYGLDLQALNQALKRFIAARYLFTYIRNEHLVFAFNRIVLRTGISGFDDKDQKLLAGLIDDIEQELWLNFSTIFKTIRIKLANEL